MALDKRTFIIVAAILVIVLPTIVLVFHKTFFPIIVSMSHTFTSAALTNGTTGVPPVIRNLFK